MAVLKKGTCTLLARLCIVAFRWLAFQQGPSVNYRRVLLLLLGTYASSMDAGSLVLRLGSSSACASMWGVSRRLRQPACGVAFTGAGLWSVEPVEGVLALLAAPFLLGVALWVEMHRLATVFWWCFPELFVVVLVRVPLPLGLLLCSFKSSAMLPPWFEAYVVWLVAIALPSRLRSALGAFGGGSPQSCFVLFWLLLLPLGGDELSLFPVGLSVLQTVWALSVKFFGWDFVCPQDQEVGLVSRALWALPDGGLGSTMGVWLVVPLVGVLASRRGFLFRVRERPVVCLLPLLSVGCSGWWCFHMAFGAMSLTVATFAVKVPPLVLS
ncbi:hypothetical protein Taro_019784 [Colocasia esculenta]|uniref:Uncharacterized protein n=1 Tax=Colocasia esculenta TaxID=4460 RepID=A0A843UUF8_COLES|nr:hypothetical protein [Colocasia esculenta]